MGVLVKEYLSSERNYYANIWMTDVQRMVLLVHKRIEPNYYFSLSYHLLKTSQIQYTDLYQLLIGQIIIINTAIQITIEHK